MSRLAGWLARRAPELACAAIVALAVVVVVATHRDYGVTWDEGVQARYGELVVDYFRSGFQDRRANDFLSLRIYGPPFEAGAALSYAGDPRQKWERRHLLTALFGLLTLPALIACCRPLRIRWLAAAASIALVTMPRFWGDLFGNSKDIPFAAAFTAAMAALAALAAGRGRTLARISVVGLAIGAAAALRPGGLPVLAALLAAALLASIVGDRARGERFFSSAIDAVWKGALALAIAWLAMIAFWPWAHEAPLANPLRAMASAAALAKVYPVLFEGRVLPSDALPARYVAQYVALTTPVMLLALAAAGLISAARRQWRAPASSASRALLLFELWWILPLAAAAVIRPNVYDGIRHFLFVLPAIALFAGLGAIGLVERAPRGVARAGLTALLAGATLWPVPALVRLHPYQYTYFNELAGGLAGAHGRYETDYWVASYREAMQWINARAREAGRPIHVLVAANRLSFPAAQAYAGEDVVLERTDRPPVGERPPTRFDYFVATYRYGSSDAFPAAPVVHEIGRDGAIFTTIKAGPRAARSGPRRPSP
ncbi:MAG: hypothetical protein FJ144_02045 [Deltaproteobacteria bacterium]|nr:hypothetical protein [Deltaproteobacteria bacterium]